MNLPPIKYKSILHKQLLECGWIKIQNKNWNIKYNIGVREEIRISVECILTYFKIHSHFINKDKHDDEEHEQTWQMNKPNSNR